MYQSPVAAIAELIANSWDADAKNIDVMLPDTLEAGAEITIKDDGAGMTLDDCQRLYLNVGRNRRLSSDRTPGNRPCLGRKGIGKFAGFGIASVIDIDTTSAVSGERTVFRMELNKLRGDDDDFVSAKRQEIEVLEYHPPDASNRTAHGTLVRLQSLKLSQRRDPQVFARYMARRFLLAQQAGDFRVHINGFDLPTSEEPFSVEFEFPRDYRDGEMPDGLTIRNGWGLEHLPDGNTIEWRFRFSDKPIDTEEFRGVSIFCGIKVAQGPFFFHLSGGLGGQHGQQYLSGVVKADYLDRGTNDIITTERQRINWEDPQAAPLLDWGQQRLTRLLGIWRDRRAEKKITAIEQRLTRFSDRLDRLISSEAKTVKRALTRIASIPAIDQPQFDELANALLTAWEGGRLRQIIEDVARVDEMDAGVLVGLLVEQNILSALHVAEVVRLKLDVISGLRRRIQNRDLENAIRDYISKYPWLISPKWETFKVERQIDLLVSDALGESGIASSVDWHGRVDLVLSSGRDLLVLEFMRPGIAVDRDHIDRFQRYVDILRARIKANTTLGFERVTGILVADRLIARPENQEAINRMAENHMLCQEWGVLFEQAASQWREFLEVLKERSPDDPRVRALSDR